MSESHHDIEKSSFLKLLPGIARDDLIKCFTEKHYEFGDIIVNEGDAADAFYLLTSGRARVLKQSENGSEIPLYIMEDGDSFGEIALLQGGQRSATVRASTKLSLMELKKDDFEKIVKSNPNVKNYLELQLKYRELQSFLKLYTDFSDMSFAFFRALLDNIQTVEYEQGEIVLHEGDVTGPMYIVESGRLTVSQESKEGVISYLRPGNIFGELSLLTGQPRSATVTAKSHCRIYRIDPENWESLIRDFPELKTVIEKRIEQYNDLAVRKPLDFYTGEFNEYQKVGLSLRESSVRIAKYGGFTFIPQIDENDCGAACLAMVALSFSLDVSMSFIREIADTGLDGTSAKGLCKASTEIGIAAQHIKVNRDKLSDLHTPAILHVSKNHWLVLIEINDDKARVADPANKISWVPVGDLKEQWTGNAITFEHSSEIEQESEKKEQPWQWLSVLLKDISWPVFSALMLTLVISFSIALLPIFVQLTIDQAIPEKDLKNLDLMVLAMVAALVGSLILTLFQRNILSRTMVKLDALIQDHIVSRMIDLPLKYFLSRTNSELQHRLVGIRAIRHFIVNDSVNGLIAMVNICLFLGLMFYFSPYMTFCFLGLMIPVYALIMLFASRVLGPAFINLQDSEESIQMLQDEMINGILSVKASAAEGYFRKKILDKFQDITREQVRSQFNISTFEGTVQAIWMLASIIFMWLGVRMTIEQQITTGSFIAFIILLALLYAPVMTVIRLWTDYHSVSLVLMKLNDILESRSEQEHHTSSVKVESLQGKIELRNVTYGNYSPLMTIRNVNLHIFPGQRVACIGRGASGKSTLSKMIAALLPPEQGSVLYDDVPVNEIDVQQLRKYISYVSHESHIFKADIASNIAFGDNKPDSESIIRAAKISNCHEQIMALDNGYETIIDDNAFKLNPHLLHHILIARAIYNEPSIIVLDEATNNFDLETEELIFNNISKNFKKSSLFISTDNVNILKKVDKILVIDTGELVEQGNHSELLARKGLYYHLVKRQTHI
ncbi:MAG: peptidase domain-containing ABC transporter [Lentisphaeria bacterium]|nr:peptidase domain-containing ABC transporter [Lentisphaeria bacterium]NQZ69860.1 peptidase domain-containing ABC transporter [Lentisphaeria bacterium]